MHNISDLEVRKAEFAHELFLFNLIFNHVFLFIVTVSVPWMQFSVIIVPVLSIIIMGYTLWMSRAPVGDMPFLHCHRQLAARRTLAFGFMWLCIAAVFLAIYMVSGGNLKPQHYAAAGLVFLPYMITTVVLVILGSEALQQARHRTLPKVSASRCVLRQSVALATA